MECPNCKTPLVITPELPSEQIMYFSIKHEHPLLAASTVHGTLKNAELLMKALGKDMGAKVNVFVHSVTQEPGELTFGLLVTTVAEKIKSAKKKPPNG